jgi:hypothetical protein
VKQETDVKQIASRAIRLLQFAVANFFVLVSYGSEKVCKQNERKNRHQRKKQIIRLPSLFQESLQS